MNELGHIRVDNNETRALIVDLADDLDLPVHEILDLAEARQVGRLLDGAHQLLLLVKAITDGEDADPSVTPAAVEAMLELVDAIGQPSATAAP